MGGRAKSTRESLGLRAALAAAVLAEDAALPGPRPILTREQSRQVDDLCIRRFGIPSILLMEHAAMALARVVGRTLTAFKSPVRQPRVLILCGPGNNGGDGLALARLLHTEGLCDRVSVVLAAPAARIAGDAAINLRAAERIGVRLVRAGRRPAATAASRAAQLGRPLLVVDALLGTGLSRPAGGAMLDLIRACNSLRADPRIAVLAVDVPSGLDCDTGEPPSGGEAVIADATLTLAAMKTGLARPVSRAWTGALGTGGIGAPTAVFGLVRVRAIRERGAKSARRADDQPPSNR